MALSGLEVLKVTSSKDEAVLGSTDKDAKGVSLLQTETLSSIFSDKKKRTLTVIPIFGLEKYDEQSDADKELTEEDVRESFRSIIEKTYGENLRKWTVEMGIYRERFVRPCIHVVLDEMKKISYKIKNEQGLVIEVEEQQWEPLNDIENAEFEARKGRRSADAVGKPPESAEERIKRERIMKIFGGSTGSAGSTAAGSAAVSRQTIADDDDDDLHAKKKKKGMSPKKLARKKEKQVQRKQKLRTTKPKSKPKQDTLEVD